MTEVAGIQADALKSFIDRIERLDEERQAISDDIKDVKSQAKSQGYDLRIITAILKLRKMDPADRAEQEDMIEIYKRALDMG